MILLVHHNFTEYCQEQLLVHHDFTDYWRKQLLVHHDFTEYRREQSTPAIRHAPSFQIDITSLHWLHALYMKPWFEKRIIEARDEAAHVGRDIDLFFTTLTVDVYSKLVQVVHVVTVCSSGIWNTNKVRLAILSLPL